MSNRVVQRGISWAARLAMYAILAGVAGVCHVAGSLRALLGGGHGRAPRRARRLLLMGTFYNRGWFRSHILPLSKCNATDEILVACDEPLFPVDKVVYVCPPAALVSIVGRSTARFLWLLWVVFTRRPDVLMGYHIMPNSLMCLVAARLTGGRAIYQMTGGPIQLIGGGVGSENVLLRQLKKPSPTLEALLFHVVRQFDVIIVRGRSARDFVVRHRLNKRCSIITGSVDTHRFCPNAVQRDIDIVYVSRLVPCKGLEAFLEILAGVARKRPSFRAAVVGDGPLLPALKRSAEKLGIDAHVEFLGKVDRVEKILRRSRLFVLVSPSEGMSIAMLEAMATGLPPVVTDVGDLRDIVEPGRTGVLLSPSKLEEAALPIVDILANPPRWSSMSRAAQSEVVARCSVDAVARRWEEVIGRGTQERYDV